MIPVMTSTKTDKSAIDLAGVEAGEKMLVPLLGVPSGPTAQGEVVDQNGRSTICQPRDKTDFVLRPNISFSPFFTSDLRTSPRRYLPPIAIAKRPTTRRCPRSGRRQFGLNSRLVADASSNARARSSSAPCRNCSWADPFLKTRRAWEVYKLRGFAGRKQLGRQR